MKKSLAYVLSCIMILSCFMMPVNIIPVSAAPDLSNKEIYFKQKSGSKYCTIDSLAMVFRRKAILDGNEDWQVITEDSMKNYKNNWNGGLSNSAAYKNTKYNLNMTSKAETFYSMKNNNGRKNSNSAKVITKLKSYLDKYPEGIAVYVYNNYKTGKKDKKGKDIYGTKWQHAVILTGYNGDTFYCADPANGAAKGIIKLTDSTLMNSSHANTKSINELFSYAVKIWHVETSKNKATTPIADGTVFKLTLDPQNSTSKQVLYEKYGYGFYFDKACTKGTSKVTVPTKKGMSFAGYYTDKNGSGTQCIDASGKIKLNTKSLKKNQTIYAYWKKVVVADKPTISVTSAPKTIKAGSSFGLRGTIKSNVNITEVTAYIIDSNGKTVQKQSDKPNAKSFNIKNGDINQKLYFGKLTEGTYTLKITATNGTYTTTYQQKFNVITKPKISVTSAPSTIKKGSGFGLRGTISSTAKITKVTACIINSKGKTVQSKSDTPNKTSFDIKNGKINQQLYFGKLAKGTYTLKITATNAAGTSTYTKKFTVK